VVDGGSGLQVIDISNPKNPRIVAACDTPGSARGIYVTGTYAYVADKQALHVIDISNPKNPRIMGACDTPGSAQSVYVTGTYAYVADAGSGLQVIEKFSPLTDVQYKDASTLIATVPPGYRPGTYNLHVTNPDGGHAMLYNAFCASGEVIPAGWSMISLPVRPEVLTVANVFPQAVVVYKYEQGTGYMHVQAGEELQVGIGYWILLDSPQPYFMEGTEITEYTLSVEDGWYMIGGCSMPAQKMVTSGNIVVIYGYTQGVGYTRVSGSEPLERGKGYWILFSNTSEEAEFTASISISE
jgi:hypothetical protein